MARQYGAVIFGGGPDSVGFKFPNKSAKEKFIDAAKAEGFTPIDRTSGRMQVVVFDL